MGPAESGWSVKRGPRLSRERIRVQPRYAMNDHAISRLTDASGQRTVVDHHYQGATMAKNSQMTQTDIERVRAHLTLKGVKTSDICSKFEVGRSAVSGVITGASVSERIQEYIAQVIGYWPDGWRRKGQPRPA